MLSLCYKVVIKYALVIFRMQLQCGLCAEVSWSLLPGSLREVIIKQLTYNCSPFSVSSFSVFNCPDGWGQQPEGNDQWGSGAEVIIASLLEAAYLLEHHNNNLISWNLGKACGYLFIYSCLQTLLFKGGYSVSSVVSWKLNENHMKTIQ